MSIVRMLKATLVGRASEAEEIITSVMDAGLLHVQPMRPPEELAELHSGTRDPLDRAAQMKRAKVAINSVTPGSREAPGLALGVVVERVEHLAQERRELNDRIIVLDSLIAALAPWGDFDPNDINELQERGAPVILARLTWNDWRELHVSDVPHVISQQNDDEVWVALFGQEASELPVDGLVLPRRKLSDVRAERDRVRTDLREAEDTLGGYHNYLGAIDARLSELADRVTVLKTKDGGMQDGPIFAIQGYLPAENQNDMGRVLSDFSVVLRFDDPEDGDAVPVKLRNNVLTQGFESIVQSFSGISYWEKDFTPTVGLLFLVFASLCLLDGGYGLLLLGTGLIMRAKGMREFGNVFALTGFFSTLVGMAAGQYFGLIVGKDGFMDGHRPPTNLASDPMASFIFSLVVGMLGMTFSYASAIWQRGWKTNATGSLLLALGVIALVIGKGAPEQALSFVIRHPPEMVVNDVATAFGFAGQGLLGLGVLAWIVFPEKIFGDNRVPNVLWTLYAGVTGFGQDTMSHMRLFGIALSGSIMAMVVNQVAALFPLAVTVIFAVFGHFFVFLLALLSMYIHTNRLIFLEFGSKCFDGGHTWYGPMQRDSST
ncbi:MAG: hypothetical protein KC502_12045 [Myxococcales bacterium]|nr:hypothetical protein [Myxococcales bacterium]